MLPYVTIDPDYDGPGPGEYTPNDPTTPEPTAPITLAPPGTSAPATSVADLVLYTGGAKLPPRPTPRRAESSLPRPDVVGTARYSAADYAAAARSLLPRGRAWSEEADSVQAAVLAGLAVTFERSDAALSAILSGTRPGQPSNMLAEWEATLGLPDPCVGANPTIAQRLDQVRGRFVGAGGQSRRAITDYASALGFTISISNYAPFRAGLSTVGNALAGDEWSFVIGIRVVEVTGTLPIDVLLCELEAVKPAESTIILLS